MTTRVFATTGYANDVTLFYEFEDGGFPITVHHSLAAYHAANPDAPEHERPVRVTITYEVENKESEK